MKRASVFLFLVVAIDLVIAFNSSAIEPLVLRSPSLPSQALQRFGVAPTPEAGSIIVGGYTKTGSFRVCVAVDHEIRLTAWEPIGCQPPRSRFTGHQAPITMLAMAGDGRSLVSADRDGVLWRWELFTGEGKQLRRSGSPITALALDDHGQRVYLALGKTLHLHDVDDGQFVELVRHTHKITTLALASQHFAWADERGRIYWRSLREEQVHELAWTALPNKATDEVKPPVFPLPKPIASLPDQPLHYVHEFDRGVVKLVFSPDGQQLVGAGGTVVRLWDVRRGRLQWEHNHHARIDWGVSFAIMNSIPMPQPPRQIGGVTDVLFTPDGRHVVSSGFADDVRVSDLQGQLVRSSHNPKQQREPRATNTGRNRLACGPGGRTLTLYQGATQFTQERIATGTVVNQVTRHRQTLTGVAVSPDGRWLVTVGDDRRLRLWRTMTGECCADIPFYSGEGQGLCFSPDGKWLCAGGAYHGFRVWQFQPEWPFFTSHDKHLSFRYRVQAFVPDQPARLVMASHVDYTLAIDLHGGKAPAFKFGVPNEPHELSLSPDGKRAALTFGYSSTSGPLLFHTQTGKPTTLEGVANLFYAERTGFSPDGRLLFASNRDRGFGVWETATGKRYLYSTKDRVNAGVFSHDGRLLALAVGERVLLYDLAHGRLLNSFRADSRLVTSLAFVGSTGLLVTGGADGVAYLWDVRREWALASPVPLELGRRIAGEGAHTGMWSKRIRVLHPVSSVALSADGKKLAVGSRDIVQLFDFTTHRELASLPADPGRVQSVAFSPDGQYVAAAGEYFDGKARPVRVWNATTHQQVLAQAETGKSPMTLVFSSDSKTLYSAGRGVCRWDIERKIALAPLPMPQDYSHVIALAPNSKTLLVGGYSPEVRVHDPNDLRGVRILTASTSKTGPDNYVYAVAFSPDGKAIATGALDGTVRLWSYPECKMQAEWKAGQGRNTGIACVSFSPQGDLLAVAGGMTFSGLMLDVEVYDVKSGKRLVTLYGMGPRVCWSLDGRYLITAEHYRYDATEHHVLFWDMNQLLGR